MFFTKAGRYFEYVLSRLARRNRFRVGIRRKRMGNIDYFPVLIHPYDVDAELHIFHMEFVRFRFVKHKKHTFSFRQRPTPRQTAVLFLRSISYFYRDRGVVYNDLGRPLRANQPQSYTCNNGYPYACANDKQIFTHQPCLS